MNRAFLIVALIFAGAPAQAQVAFGNHAPGLQLGGVAPPPPNAAPSVPPGGLSPSGTAPGYAAPAPPTGSNAIGSLNTAPTVLPGGYTPKLDTGSPSSEAAARAKVEHAGYGSVSSMTKGLDGVWRGTAKLDAREVKVEVDMFGAVRAF
jgi:hypothetical protein